LAALAACGEPVPQDGARDASLVSSADDGIEGALDTAEVERPDRDAANAETATEPPLSSPTPADSHTADTPAPSVEDPGPTAAVDKPLQSPAVDPPSVAPAAGPGPEIAIAPAPPKAPAEPPPPPAIDDDPDRLMGLGTTDLTRMLGDPRFVRRDSSAQLWRYRNKTCILDLFLYRGKGRPEYEVSHIETRRREGGASPMRECFGALLMEQMKRKAG
jgi:hypothetical protein